MVLIGFDISVITKHTQPSAVINTTEASASPLIAVLTYEAGFRAENILVALICFSSVLVAVQRTLLADFLSDCHLAGKGSRRSSHQLYSEYPAKCV
jgi:hypothetical protein